MGLENFTPSIWSAKLFVRLRKNLVFANLTNQDYEGEVTPGGSVRINEISPVTVSDYTKNATFSWQNLNSAQKILYIDQQKVFAVSVDSIDRVQNKPDLMDGIMDEASYAVADTVDQFIASKYGDAGITGTSTNIGSSGSILSITTGNAVTTLTFASRYMDEANVPRLGRVAVIPPWYAQKLGLQITGVNGGTNVPKPAAESIALNGYMGFYWGFDIYVSNNVSSATTTYRPMFFTKQAISYAGQIAQIKPVDRQDTFAEGVKGLYVYGAKVARPEALCTIYVSEGSG